MKIYSLLVIGLLFLSGCQIDPSKTYAVYSVVDANGNKYDNLIPINYPDGNQFLSINRKQTYIFHGNYTVISATISGKDVIKNRLEKE
jgi:PBP1b-binding outer membrane lipoprotein LpoB